MPPEHSIPDSKAVPPPTLSGSEVFRKFCEWSRRPRNPQAQLAEAINRLCDVVERVARG